MGRFNCFYFDCFNLQFVIDQEFIRNFRKDWIKRCVFSSLNAFGFCSIFFLVRSKYNLKYSFSLLQYKALLKSGEKKPTNFSTPKCVLTQILRKVLSHTKDCMVSVSRSHEVLYHCGEINLSSVCDFFPLKICITSNALVAAILLNLPFLISYSKYLNFCYKFTVALTLELPFPRVKVGV